MLCTEQEGEWMNLYLRDGQQLLEDITKKTKNKKISVWKNKEREFVCGYHLQKHSLLGFFLLLPLLLLR